MSIMMLCIAAFGKRKQKETVRALDGIIKLGGKSLLENDTRILHCIQLNGSFNRTGPLSSTCTFMIGVG